MIRSLGYYPIPRECPASPLLRLLSVPESGQSGHRRAWSPVLGVAGPISEPLPVGPGAESGHEIGPQPLIFRAPGPIGPIPRGKRFVLCDRCKFLQAFAHRHPRLSLARRAHPAESPLSARALPATAGTARQDRPNRFRYPPSPRTAPSQRHPPAGAAEDQVIQQLGTDQFPSLREPTSEGEVFRARSWVPARVAVK